MPQPPLQHRPAECRCSGGGLVANATPDEARQRRALGALLQSHHERLSEDLQAWVAQQERLLRQLLAEDRLLTRARLAREEDWQLRQVSAGGEEALASTVERAPPSPPSPACSLADGAQPTTEPAPEQGEEKEEGNGGSGSMQLRRSWSGVLESPRSRAECMAKLVALEESGAQGSDEGVADFQLQGSDASSKRFRRNSHVSLLSSMSEEEEERKQLAKAASVPLSDNSAASKESIQNGETSCSMCHKRLRRWVQSQQFELCSAVVLIANTLYFGVEIEYLVQRGPGQDAPLVFLIIQQTFAVFFLSELALRFFSERCAFFVGEQRFWNCLDVFAVASCLMEVVTDTLQRARGGSTVQETFDSSTGMIRIVRVARLVRIFRITRIVRFVRSLRTLVYSIVCTLKSLFWSLLLLVGIIYSFGIFFTQAVFDYLADLGAASGAVTGAEAREGCAGASPGYTWAGLHLHWGSLGASMLTLFEAITGGVSWGEVADPLADAHILCKVAFVCFVAFCLLAVLNVVTAVFCQSAIESAQRDQDAVLHTQMSNRKQYVAWVRRCFQGIDSSGSGSITLTEFENHINDERMQAFLASLEIDTDDAWTLFKLLDSDESNAIDLDEFALGCLKLKGAARSVDLALQSKEIQWLVQKTTLFIVYVEEQFTKLLGESAKLGVGKEAQREIHTEPLMLRKRSKERTAALQEEPAETFVTPSPAQARGTPEDPLADHSLL